MKYALTAICTSMTLGQLTSNNSKINTLFIEGEMHYYW